MSKPTIKYHLRGEDYGNYLVLRVSIKVGRGDMPTNLDMLDIMENVVAPDIRKKSVAGEMIPMKGEL
jgi:hypothetical protein